MTLWLARRVEHGEVDETSTTYIGLCDDDGCRHMVDHRDEQIVADALAGHRRRAHVDSAAERAGWLTFTGPGIRPVETAPIADHPVARANVARADDARLADSRQMPSPHPRGQESP